VLEIIIPGRVGIHCGFGIMTYWYEIWNRPLTCQVFLSVFLGMTNKILVMVTSRACEKNIQKKAALCRAANGSWSGYLEGAMNWK
jgi:hypothetical protein